MYLINSKQHISNHLNLNLALEMLIVYIFLQ